MLLLFGGDSEIGAATYRYLEGEGRAVKSTTRRRDTVSPERPYFNILTSLDCWSPPPETTAACIFLAIARLQDCAADPARSALTNVAQSLRLVDTLLASGIYVLFLSSNQVFDGELANVGVDVPLCPVSEYGRQKAQIETAIHERMAKGAPIAILRFSKVFTPNSPLIENWIQSLRRGDPIYAFDDVAVAPVPAVAATKAIAALLDAKMPGVFQLTGPRDLTYSEVGNYLARELGADPDLVVPTSAYSMGMPSGSTPRHTTLDSSALRDTFGIVVPDALDVLSSYLDVWKRDSARAQIPGAKLIALEDLSEVADGVYYSRYPLPLIDAAVIAFLKQAAAKSPLKRARFCAHLSPEAEQHDMLIVSHRDTYVTPHRHFNKSETFVIIEGFAEVILFGENGDVEKTIKMGPPASGRPFFYRMPPRQYHSISIESDSLVFLESTKGPFDLGDREHATWAPDYKESDRGKAFIEAIVYK